MGAAAPILPVIAAVTGLVGAGATLYGATRSPNIPKPEAPPELPAIPEPELPEQRRKSGRADTILTQPSGIGSPVTSFKPTLLGQ